MKRTPDPTANPRGKGKPERRRRPRTRKCAPNPSPRDPLYSVERARRALSSSTRILVRAVSAEDLMTGVCRIAVREGGYLFAWVGLIDDAAEKSVVIGGQYGLGQNYLSSSQISYNGRKKDGRGPTGTAIRTGEMALVGDAATDPSFAPWRDAAKERGFASVLALPLLHDGKAFGSFTIYAPEIDAFGQEEIELLESLTEEIAYGVVARRDAEVRRQAEESFQTVFRNNPSVSAITDPEMGLHFDVNFAWCRTLGYAREEAIGRTSAELNLWVSLEQRNRIVKAIKRHGSVHNADARLRAKNGAIRDLLVSGELINIHGASRLLLTSQDITERKMHEAALWNAHMALEHKVGERTKALHESEDRFRDFAEVSADWLWETDADHRFTMISADTDGTSVHRRIPVIGMTRLEIIDASLEPKKWARHKRDLDLHKPFRNFEYLIHTPDGVCHWIRINGKPIFGDDGAFLGYRGTGMDVTAEVEAQTALRKSEQRFRNLIESSLQGIYIHRNFKPLFANPAMAAMFGYETPDDLLRIDSVLDLFDPKEAQRLKELILARGAGKESPQIYEAAAKKKDGTPFRIQVLAAAVDWEGKPALQAAVIDVTELERAEIKMRKAMEEAQIANRTKTEFLANMSHELRTPLNAVIGFSDMLRQGYLGHKCHSQCGSYVTDIYNSGKHLLEIINDILDVAAIESGNLALGESEVDTLGAIMACLRIVSAKATKGGVRFEPLPESIPHILGDGRRVKQIFINLLSNAVKFTPEGGHVMIESSIGEDGHLSVTIRDTGIGMDEKGLEVALRPFGMVDASLSRQREGTGLGLPLSKHLIEAHGGRMDIESVPGKGTAVTIRFPPERVILSS